MQDVFMNNVFYGNMSDYEVQVLLDILISKFLNSVKLKMSSKATYNSQLRSFALWFKRQKISQPDEQSIISFCSYLKHDKNCSDLTVKGYLTALKSFFSWVNVANSYPDIARNVHVPEYTYKPRKTSLTSNQVKILLDSIDCATLEGKRDFALINLMIGTGLRCIEIKNLVRGDIADCCGLQVLWIRAKEVNGEGENMYIPDNVFKPIKNYLEARESTSDTDYLFISHSKKNFGQPLTVRSISRIIKNRLIDAKIDYSRLSPSSLRYTSIQLNLLMYTNQEQAHGMMQKADINTMLAYTRQLKNQQIKVSRKKNTKLF